MRRERLIYLLQAAVLLGLYFISARLGLKVNAVSGFATLVWVPTGLSLAFLFRFGQRLWPAVALGALLANYFTGAPFLAALGISVGNTLEAVAGVYLLKRFVKFNPTLERINDTLGLIALAALLSTLISATIGVTSLWLNGVIKLSAYDNTWAAWWSGDVISDLVIAPFLLVWSSRPTIKIKPGYLIELTALILILILIGGVVFNGFGINFVAKSPRTYMVFPLLIWAALRFSPKESTLAVLIFSAIATLETANGHGPFRTNSPSDNLLNLQTYMAVVASTTMILTAAVSERRIYERKKDEFISVASHELKTPLTSVKLFSQTLQQLFERKGDEQSSEQMSRINRQIDRLNRLVVKMLDLSRIQEGRVTLQKERFNIGKLVREIVEEVAETTPHKIIVQGNTNATIVADRDRIGRVLTNLLSNAATYSPKTGRIIVRVSRDKEYLTISVQDFGIGIPNKDQEHIFERFYQAENQKATSDSNLGLGLFIAKSIVERHGGRIWLKNSKDSGRGASGSTFYFTLPLKS